MYLSRPSRHLSRLGNLKPMDNTLPFDFGLPEIDAQTESPAGGAQVVEALRSVFVGETLDTFQLDHQHVFNQDIGEVLPDVVAFVCYGKRSLGCSPDATKAEFCEQSTFVDSFEESRAKGVRDLKHSAEHALCQ